MAIPYSLGLRSSNPTDTNAKKKVYVYSQYHEILTLDDFARHIAEHGSCFSRANIAAVLMEAVDCLREQLLLGNRVKLGELGTFSVGLHTHGTNGAGEFDPQSDLVRVVPRWQRSRQFEDLMNDATYTYVGTRKSQSENRKAQKEAIDKKMGEA